MYYIGIDLGGTNIAAGLVDDNCKILCKDSVPTNAAGRTADEIITDMAKLALRLTAKAGLKPENIAWVGIGTPGSINKEKGIAEFAGNLPFKMTPMTDVFHKTWDIPVIIENDANAAALGEAYAGAAKGCRHAAMITLGTGVGGGFVIDRKIYAGFNFNGAEVGHMVIVHGGRLCTCGRRGCWETYASVSGLIADTKEAMRAHPESAMWSIAGGSLDAVNGKTSFVAARQGDAAGMEVVDQYLAYVATGVTNLINIFQPEVFCIGGAISKEGDFLLEPIRKHVVEERFTRYCSQTELKIATLGNDAGIIGAAMLGK